MYIPREWCATPRTEGAGDACDGGGGAGARKRKVELSMEDLMRGTRSEKTLKLMVEGANEVCMESNSRAKSPILLGGKIRDWEGADGRTVNGTKEGAGFKTLTEKEGGIAGLGLDQMTTRNI